MKSSPSTQQFIDIENIEEDVVILKNSGLRQIVMVSGINLDLVSEEERNTTLHLYQNFLNSLDFPTQFLIHSRKFNIENYLKNIDELEKNETNSLLKNQIFEYKQFIKSFVEQNDIMSKMFLVVIPFNPISLMPKSGLFSFFNFKKKKEDKTDKLNTIAEQEKQINFRQLRGRTDQVIDGLQSVGLRAVALNNEELIELFYNFYNPENTEKEKLAILNQTEQKS